MAFNRFFPFNTEEAKTLEKLVNDAAVGVPATTTTQGTVLRAAAQNPAAAADVAALKTQFDALLVKLKASGQMAS